ncbi:uncharacterized protein LOC127266130 [Andrographis paniculata]|uniref:uncharacterized protein LOC127266130 n=1 Tax=Andrographis paniculata TaxID=175694 RepID=UPI0021E8E6BD|nr:uncharacterized protein LOC127266130 [Andrographis paniculata]
MDFTLKGKSWAGNIYHRFESICHDVDDLISKPIGHDTVKFVENQVQRFYSNAAQDITPPSGDTVKSKSQSMDCQQFEIPDYASSVLDFRAEPVCVKENHLSAYKKCSDTTRNSDAQLQNELGQGMQSTGNPSTDESQEEESNPQFREDGNDIDPHDDNTKNSMQLTARSSSSKGICAEISDDGRTNSSWVSDSLPVPSSHEIQTSGEDLKVSNLNMDYFPELETLKKETITCHSSSDDIGSPSNVSVGVCGSTPDSPTRSSVSDDNRSGSAPSETSAVEFNELELLTMDSPLPSTSNAADRSLGSDGTLFSQSFSTKDENFESSSSIQSSNPMKSRDCLRSKSADSMINVKDTEHFHQEFHPCAYNSSTPLEGVADDTRAVDAFPTLFISELNEKNASRINASKLEAGLSEIRHKQQPQNGDSKILMLSSKIEKNVSWINTSKLEVGSSESRHKQQPQNGDSKLLMPSSNIGSQYVFGIDDLNMESIDLTSNTKCCEQKAIFNPILTTQFISHRRKGFRYYKNLIQDALTYHKRVSNEYKHLSILYEDIDNESSLQFDPCPVSSSPGIHLHAIGTQPSQETPDPDWELI